MGFNETLSEAGAPLGKALVLVVARPAMALLSLAGEIDVPPLLPLKTMTPPLNAFQNHLLLCRAVLLEFRYLRLVLLLCESKPGLVTVSLPWLWLLGVPPLLPLQAMTSPFNAFPNHRLLCLPLLLEFRYLLRVLPLRESKPGLVNVSLLGLLLLSVHRRLGSLYLLLSLSPIPLTALLVSLLPVSAPVLFRCWLHLISHPHALRDSVP
uniref:Uncharacterized protein n=1 Tax=Haptolina brevifila TaxID=156173 RepID=A0A7S2E3X0_9EUKA|mmetsp:Transcript_47262/g.94176  ORF Transcript_47262/g.94176 Transcript_47262/m.94176 type:complete len:209 (+) Transcript_47262:2258-2884(+)